LLVRLRDELIVPGTTKPRRWQAPGLLIGGNSRGLVVRTRERSQPRVGGNVYTLDDSRQYRSFANEGLNMANNLPKRPQRRPRFPLSDEAIADIWARLRAGDYQHDIAADYGTNAGRVSEINTGRRGNHVTGLPQR